MKWFKRSGEEHTGKVFNVKTDSASYSYIATCHRCGGLGGSDAWAHTGWKCYECGGSGKLGEKTARVFSAEKLKALNVAKENKDAKAQAKRDAEIAAKRAEIAKERAAFEAANADFVTRLLAPSENAFIFELRAKLDQFGTLTAVQVTAANNVFAREDSEKSAAPCPIGRVEITGLILSTKYVSTGFGDVCKMLVQHETGFKVWGSAPGGLNGELKGRKVAFTAAVEPSKDDPKFGFFKRPTKARFVE
jgi:hypothetical protein